MTAKRRQVEKQCGTCKWWENTYRNSRIVEASVGSCDYPFDWNLVPYSLQLGIKGWHATDKRDGSQCPTWEAKTSLKKSHK